MQPLGLGTVIGGTLGGGSVALGRWAVDQVANNGPDLLGVAAVIAAIGGLVTAVGTIALGWRSREKADEDDKRDEIMLKLVDKLLEAREEEE